jgi:hypothetical protein
MSESTLHFCRVTALPPAPAADPPNLPADAVNALIPSVSFIPKTWRDLNIRPKFVG